MPGLSTEQGLNSYQDSHPTYTSSWMKVFSYHVDLVGPLPQSSGYTYLFTIVDRRSGWPEAIPLLVERFHHRLKVSLRANWFNHLPLVLLGLLSVPTEESAIYASEILFGSPVLPREFMDSLELPSSEYLRRLQSILKNNFTVLPHHSTVTSLKTDSS